MSIFFPPSIANIFLTFFLSCAFLRCMDVALDVDDAYDTQIIISDGGGVGRVLDMCSTNKLL